MSIAKPRIELDDILNEIAQSVQSEIETGEERFEAFGTAFEKEFGREDATRGMANALTWAIMTGPLALFYIGETGATIVELYAYLEVSDSTEPTSVPEPIEAGQENALEGATPIVNPYSESKEVDSATTGQK